MSTTLIFAELLIIGIQATFWLGLLVMSILGYKWMPTSSPISISNWQPLILIILLSFAYVLGIIMDRFADLIFAGWDKRLKNRIITNPSISISMMRFSGSEDNESLNQQFEYTRSRMRIARSSSINFALTTLFAVLFVLFQVPNAVLINKSTLVTAIVIVGVLVTIGAIYTWHKLTRTYLNLTKSSYELYKSRQKEEEPNKSTKKSMIKK